MQSRKVSSTVRLDIARVQEAIALRGYKYSALADSVGVSTNAIKNWLSGRTQAIYRKNAVLLAKSLNCSLGEIVADLPASPPKRPLPNPARLGAILSIFDHRIKVFGLLKIGGSVSPTHSGEVRAVFSNLLRSLGAEVEDFGSCHVFVFPPPEGASPSKQIAAAGERLRSFEADAASIKAKFSCCAIRYRMVLSLSDGNQLDHGLDASADTCLAKVLGYIDACASMPAGTEGIFANEHLYQLARSVEGCPLSCHHVPIEVGKCKFYSLRLQDIAPPAQQQEPYVWRQPLRDWIEVHRDAQHLHFYGEEGVGKSALLTRITDEAIGFCGGHEPVGPIGGINHEPSERPAALELIAQYMGELEVAGHPIPAIKQFIRAKCLDISPVIDSILLSRLGYEPFSQRDRLYDPSVLDRFCYRAITRLVQLDARVRKTVLLIDDCDGLDAFSQGFVDYVLTQLSSLPNLKLVTTGRKKLDSPFLDPKACPSYKLENFTTHEVKQAFRDLPKADDPELIQGIVTFTKGHPLLIVEIQRRWWEYCDVSSTVGDDIPIGPILGQMPASPRALWPNSRKPHHNLYYLLTKGLAPLDIEALQILAVAGYGLVETAVIAHLDWSLSGEHKLSSVLATIAEGSGKSIVRRTSQGYHYRHRLHHLAFKKSVAEGTKAKVHLVLHSYWEGVRAAGSFAESERNHVYAHLLRHSRGCRHYEEFARYASDHYGDLLRQGKTEGLVEFIERTIRILAKVDESASIRSGICQLYLLKAKTVLISQGWTHPDVMRCLKSCERYDTAGAFQPIVAFLKLYVYLETGHRSKFAALFLQLDKKAIKEQMPVIYAAMMTLVSCSVFMTGNLAQGFKYIGEALEVYDAVGSPEAFIEHLDLDYGVWIHGSFAFLYFVAGNRAKSDQSLAASRKLCEGQEHLSTVGCQLLHEAILGVLHGDTKRVRLSTKRYLRKTAQLGSAQATIWPFYYWAVGNEQQLVAHVERFKSAGNFLLCSFFLLMVAQVQWRRGNLATARDTLRDALAFEKGLGQTFVTQVLASKLFVHPLCEGDTRSPAKGSS